jgi:hypothetical protein
MNSISLKSEFQSQEIRPLDHYPIICVKGHKSCVQRSKISLDLSEQNNKKV